MFTASNDTVDYLQIDMDRLTAGRTGLSVIRIEDELRALLEGAPAGIVSEAQKRTNIVIRGPEALREAPELFMQSQLASGDGGLIRIGDVAQLRRVAGAVKVDRENASRFAIVQAYVSGRDLVGFVEDAQRAVAGKVTLPPGYRLVWGGEFENQRRAAARLAIVVPIALGLIFVLFATLRSVRQSVLILGNVPFALIGGILALWVSGEYLSVPASVGFIALLGIAVLNGLVLVIHFNQLLASGTALDQVVLEGSLLAAAARAHDSEHSRLRARAAPVRQRTGVRDPEAAGHRGNRRTRDFDRAHAGFAADPHSAASASHENCQTEVRSLSWTNPLAS